MAGKIIPLFQDILLVSFLPWIIMVDDVGYTVFIASVGDNADMFPENNNISALPFFYSGNIGGKADGGVRKKDAQVFDSPEVDVRIWFVNMIILGIFCNIFH